ncbi:hypothetical protein [Pseudodesulfovibrio pelocollis]|uniref:hypothetical protein n=1 Tax=Pseudodesulfovibrio pelocollis TaxID=3051432 RepID=UPI00255AD0AA|nr:hypothetical protein [Pseudodesulfovibrio sp. SB368]
MVLVIPFAALAEVKEDLTLKADKVWFRQETFSVKGDADHGQYRQVKFVIPEGNLLLGLDVKVLARFPENESPFSALSTTGWRLTHIDKFPEYNSGDHPESSFTIEMWAHKYGNWHAPRRAEISLQVSYVYYDLAGIEAVEFNLAVDETLKNIHPMPTHITAQDAFEKIDRTDGPIKGIEEVTLRSDERCYWGSQPSCTDCMMVRYNNSTGKRTLRYFYNARPADGFCE